MNQTTKEAKLRQIISGFFVIKYKNKLYKYYEPTNAVMADLPIYLFGIEEQLIKDGFISDEECKKILIVQNLWSEEKEQELQTCHKDINKLHAEKPQYKYQEKAIKSIDLAISKLEERIQELSSIRNSMFSQTLEYQKINRTNQLLLFLSLKNIDESKYWSDFESFENDTPSNEIEELLKLTINTTRCSEKEIREIARTEPWRTMWKTSSKTGMSLFKSCSSDLTKSQYELCYWSNVYDSVYESSDFPGHDVVDDDERLDLWFIDQANKHRSNNDSTQIAQNKKILGAKEVFIKVDTPDDAKKVYSEMNTKDSRKIIKDRLDSIDKHGNLNEDKLPDVQTNLRMEINRMSVEKNNGR
jgi:hypothetical protein